VAASGPWTAAGAEGGGFWGSGRSRIRRASLSAAGSTPRRSEWARARSAPARSPRARRDSAWRR